MKLKGPTRLVVLGIKLIIETAADFWDFPKMKPSAPVRFRMDWAH